LNFEKKTWKESNQAIFAIPVKSEHLSAESHRGSAAESLQINENKKRSRARNPSPGKMSQPFIKEYLHIFSNVVTISQMSNNNFSQVGGTNSGSFFIFAYFQTLCRQALMALLTERLRLDWKGRNGLM
jgi:hypothetical protein